MRRGLGFACQSAYLAWQDSKGLLRFADVCSLQDSLLRRWEFSFLRVSVEDTDHRCRNPVATELSRSSGGEMNQNNQSFKGQFILGMLRDLQGNALATDSISHHVSLIQARQSAPRVAIAGDLSITRAKRIRDGNLSIDKF
jgi:hypothetical protein